MKYSLNKLIDVVREAGNLLCEQFRRVHFTPQPPDSPGSMDHDAIFKSEKELVLGVDLLSQEVLIRGAGHLLPDLTVYSEESDNWHNFFSDRKKKLLSTLWMAPTTSTLVYPSGG